MSVGGRDLRQPHENLSALWPTATGTRHASTSNDNGGPSRLGEGLARPQGALWRGRGPRLSLAARVSTHGDPENDYDDQGTEHLACVDVFEASTVGSIAIEDGLGSG
jgi:hypothetical protein